MHLQKKDLVVLAQLQKALELFGLRSDSVTQAGSNGLTICAHIPRKSCFEIYFWFKLNQWEDRVVNWKLRFETTSGRYSINRKESRQPATLRHFRKMLRI